MCRPQKDPLRSLSQEERKTLEQFSCCLTQPADQVIHAKEVLAVADGHTFTDAATLAERKSGAVAHLVTRFNKEGLFALETRHGGGLPILYTQVEREHILKEFRRSPDSPHLAKLLCGWKTPPPGILIRRPLSGAGSVKRDVIAHVTSDMHSVAVELAVPGQLEIDEFLFIKRYEGGK